MKQKCLHIISIALGMVLVLLYGGCAADSTNESVEAPLREVHFMLGAHNYADMTSTNIHRALPNGYVIYDDFSPKIPVDEAALRCYMTQGNEIKFQGNLTYKSDIWVSKIPLDNGVYHVYGLMPGAEAGKVKLNTLSGDNFANGAIMTINGLNSVTTSDVCAIVGVKGASSKVGIADVGIELGKFSYDAQNDGTYVYLLIDHLYAAIQLNMNISSDYNALRTIKLTKLTLRSKTVKTANVTATLTPNITNASPLTEPLPTVTTAVSGEGTEVEIYKGVEQELEENKDLTFVACTAPISTNTQFVMKTIYNVYDRKGNLIRKDCTAENVLNLPTGGLTRGQKYTFNLTVNPTYLYVLSDPDLDNPTVTVN